MEAQNGALEVCLFDEEYDRHQSITVMRIPNLAVNFHFLF
jgi:hypothetical protein